MYFFEQPSRLDAALLMDSARLWITLLYTVRRIGLVMPSATVVLYFQLVILIDCLVDCLVVRKVYGHPCYRHCKCKMSSKIMYAFYMKGDMIFIMTMYLFSKLKSTKPLTQTCNYINDLNSSHYMQ